MLRYTYLYENTMFTNKMRSSINGKENPWEEGWVRKELALIKSLIYVREKKMHVARLNKINQIMSNLSADKFGFN